MKIEKVNDHQIRCTLTRDDLADRELKLSELAYGTEKAKSLFRDMMQQASFEFGFEAEDIPLMIEAIPLNSDCIVLIITKVEDPEELDTRFSKFAPSVHDDSQELDDMLDSIAEGADDVLDLFKKLQNSQLNEEDASSDTPRADIEAAVEETDETPDNEIAVPKELTKIYTFSSLQEVTRLAHILSGRYDGVNSLYKTDSGNAYILVISKSSHTPVEFNKVCNILSEYGFASKSVVASEAYLEEHFEPIIRGKALQTLAKF